MTTQDVFEAIKRGDRPRILAFGSSNTQRFQSGMHWFDCFELAVAQTHGALARCINSGVSGDTAAMLLQRFDRDAALFRPHMTFITIGGNDSNPERHVTTGQFRRNLLDLHSRLDALGSAVVFQTYYAPDPARAWPLEGFYAHMDTIRNVASETGADLIDHLARWVPLREQYPEVYAQVMRDGFHVNRLGNMVLGLDIARHYDLQLGTDAPDYWATARKIHAVLNEEC